MTGCDIVRVDRIAGLEVSVTWIPPLMSGLENALMARDPKDVAYDLLERYLAFLSFDAKLDYLARFIRTGQFERVVDSKHPEDAFALRTALEKTVPRLTREDAEIVARRLLQRFVRVQIDSMVAKELTAPLPKAITKRKVSKHDHDSIRLIKVVIPDHGEPLVASDLAEFLTLFGDVYTLAADLPENPSPAARSREFYLTQLDETADSALGKEPAEQLLIQRIRKASPLTIWFRGIATLVVIAAILSGGEVKIAGLSCKLKPLGYGLKKLREAFSEHPALSRRVASKRTKGLPPAV